MNNSYFFGMQITWWIIWFILLFWIFATPYDIPGQRNKKNSPLDILQKRFASGEITTNQYEVMKKQLQLDGAM